MKVETQWLIDYYQKQLDNATNGYEIDYFRDIIHKLREGYEMTWKKITSKTTGSKPVKLLGENTQCIIEDGKFIISKVDKSK
jgi:hypothetical protein